VIDPKDGTVVGTIDLGGAMEQAQSDGQGHLYVDLEDENKIAVVDVKALKVSPSMTSAARAAGRAASVWTRRTTSCSPCATNPPRLRRSQCRRWKVLATLPIGNGTDGGGFNPNTMEAFSSQGDGTLTIIKESSPTSFAVEQTVTNQARRKTCSLDTKNNQIIVVAPNAPQAAAAAAPLPAPATNAPAGGGRRGGRGGPGNLDVLVVGR
jgi:hypothetical protein